MTKNTQDCAHTNVKEETTSTQQLSVSWTEKDAGMRFT